MVKSLTLLQHDRDLLEGDRVASNVALQASLHWGCNRQTLLLQSIPSNDTLTIDLSGLNSILS